MEKKLRLGALILSLSGAAIGCTTISCYSPVQSNEIILDNKLMSGDTTTIKNNGTDTITGKIVYRSGDTFSYAVIDSLDQIIMKGNILPVDSTFDEDTEEFLIKLNTTFAPGKYRLNFYEFPADEINDCCFRYSYPFKIK